MTREELEKKSDELYPYSGWNKIQRGAFMACADILLPLLTESNKELHFRKSEIEVYKEEENSLRSQLADLDNMWRINLAASEARKCSHGPYKFWGTDECRLCGSGRIQLYYLEDKCIECQPKPPQSECTRHQVFVGGKCVNCGGGV
jgi:hypothetical protein